MGKLSVEISRPVLTFLHTVNYWWIAEENNLKVYYSTYLNATTQRVTHRNYLAALHRQLHTLSKSNCHTNRIPFPNWCSRYSPLLKVQYLNYLEGQFQQMNFIKPGFYQSQPWLAIAIFYMGSLFANTYSMEKNPKTIEKYSWKYNFFLSLNISMKTLWWTIAQRVCWIMSNEKLTSSNTRHGCLHK